MQKTTALTITDPAQHSEATLHQWSADAGVGVGATGLTDRKLPFSGADLRLGSRRRIKSLWRGTAGQAAEVGVLGEEGNTGIIDWKIVRLLR